MREGESLTVTKPKCNQILETTQSLSMDGKEQIQSCSTGNIQGCIDNVSPIISDSTKHFKFSISSVSVTFNNTTESFSVIFNKYKFQISFYFYSHFIEVFMESLYTSDTPSLAWPVKWKISMT